LPGLFFDFLFFTTFFFATLCWGGLFATTPAARSKRSHASGCNSMSFEDDGVLDMQLLSRVNPRARVAIGMPDTMAKQPAVAAKIAECISEFSNLETMLPVTLAFLLSSDAQTALAMWGALENRGAQTRMLDAAAKEVLDDDRYDCFTVLRLKFIKRCQNERDRFAHWSWGYSIDVPDKLLLTNPLEKAKVHWTYINPPRTPEFDKSKLYVVGVDDLDRSVGRINDAVELLELFMKSIWAEPPPSVCDQYHQQLCSERRFAPLLQAHKDRNKNPPSQPQSPPSDQSGEQ
jgi:hypothetical protein